MLIVWLAVWRLSVHYVCPVREELWGRGPVERWSAQWRVLIEKWGWEDPQQKGASTPWSRSLEVSGPWARANSSRVSNPGGSFSPRVSSPLGDACSLVGELPKVKHPTRWWASCPGPSGLLAGGRAALGWAACLLVGEMLARWWASCLLAGRWVALGRVACSLVGELPWAERPTRWWESYPRPSGLLAGGRGLFTGGRAALGRAACSLVGELPACWSAP